MATKHARPLPILQYSLPLAILKRRWALMAFLTLFFVGCDSPEPVASAAASQGEKEVIDKPESPTTEIPQVETATVTDDWTTEETTEDPGCYYTEGLNIEVVALRQVHLDEIQSCREEYPITGEDTGFLYHMHYLCRHEADFKLARTRENVIEDCFDDNTEAFHVDYCALHLGAVELNLCLNGKGTDEGVWDTCEALRDTRYDDAIASGECEV